MRYPSASKFALSEICGFSFTVVTDWPWEPPGAASSYGKAVGKCVEDYEKLGGYSFDAIMDEYGILRRQRESIRLAVEYFCSVLDAENAVFRLVEYAMALNLKTWRVRPARDYKDKRSGEMIIIPDVISARPDGVMVIRDWKAKKPPVAFPGDWPQMNLGAVAAAELFGVVTVAQELRYCNVKKGEIVPNTLTRVLDAFALDDLRENIRQHIERLPTMQTAVSGEHCDDLYCALRPREGVENLCPAWALEAAV